MPVKAGVLYTNDGKFTPIAGLEIASTKTKNWFTDGWSVDALASTKSVGVGVSKDLFKIKDRITIEATAGAFLNKTYGAGLGASIRF